MQNQKDGDDLNSYAGSAIMKQITNLKVRDIMKDCMIRNFSNAIIATIALKLKSIINHIFKEFIPNNMKRKVK